MSEGNTNTPPVRRRRYAPRSKGGCLPCRRRKKRCSGETPECETCLRLNIQCVYESKRRVDSPQETGTGSSSGSGVATPAPAAFDAGGGSTTISTHMIPSTSGSLPIPMGRQISPVHIRHNQTNTAPSSYDIDQRVLMSYYIHSFVPNISVANVASNFFISVYVPMAFQCEGVLDAIVAAASAHLAKGATDNHRRARLLHVSATREARCHRFLQDRISLSGQLQSDALEVMTIILLLVGLEVQNGGRTAKWIGQLDCVRSIIRQYGGKEAFCRSSWEAECLYQHFLYHDVMSLIMDGVSSRQAPADEDALVDVEVGSSPAVPRGLGVRTPWHEYISGDDDLGALDPVLAVTPGIVFDSAHPLLGLSKHLFFLIQKIRQVRVVEDVAGLFIPADNNLFLNLEREITAVKFDLYPSTEVPTLDVAVRLDLLTLAETYRLAALILLYRRSVAHAHQLPIIASHIIRLVEKIPSGNAAEAGLTYPLFLAGAELTREDDIVSCATKLISIRQRVNILNIQAVETVLEEVWRDRLNGGVGKDWERILQEWQWVINLG